MMNPLGKVFNGIIPVALFRIQIVQSVCGCISETRCQGISGFNIFDHAASHKITGAFLIIRDNDQKPFIFCARIQADIVIFQTDLTDSLCCWAVCTGGKNILSGISVNQPELGCLKMDYAINFF